MKDARRRPHLFAAHIDIRRLLIGIVAVLITTAASGATTPTPAEAERALSRAVTFFHRRVAVHGGYVWQTSGDLSLRAGEGRAGKTLIWVQPPGTPTVGEAFLDAYDATSDRLHLDAARDAGHALVLGQRHSGGWFYSVEFDPRRRAAISYRCDVDWRRTPSPSSTRDRRSGDGWEAWKRRRYRGNLTILDDDTTQSALRFLMRLDKALDFKDKRVHEATKYGLTSVLNAQYPNGAWSANYDRFPEKPPRPKRYPVKKASYPETWSRTWPKDFTGCYVLNDNVVPDMIVTLLRAHEIYGDRRYLDSARKAGDFLILAQMPDPQPAWAQQYDRDMHPVWDRAFEPPAISGAESQTVLDVLMKLYRVAPDRRYLDAVGRALVYLDRSQLPAGRLARFYELKTNRPLYFARDRNRRYRLTYEADRLPTHYAFVVGSRLDTLETKHRHLRAMSAAELRRHTDRPTEPVTPALRRRVGDIINSMDTRGAWVERGHLKAHKTEPASGIIDSRIFARNVRILADWIRRSR